MKIVKLNIDENFFKDKLSEEYKNSKVIYKNATIGIDNTLELECIIINDKIQEND